MPTITKKNYLLLFLGIILIGLFTLWPSFNLALTGDDYLGLWRYYYHINGDVGTYWNNISYFLTSYGPEDMITALIYSFAKHNAIYYYIISFIFRITLSFSFIPLIYYLTKNKFAAFFSGFFFMVSATGLETTDWSFNMPSYISLTIFNIFLLFYLRAKNTRGVKLMILSGLLFFISIIVQPIRMTGLPIFVILLFIYNLLTSKNKLDFKFSLLTLFVFSLSFFSIFLAGNSLGAQTNVKGFRNRIEVTWKGRIGSSSAGIVEQIKTKNYHVLLYPVVQAGSIIFPSNLLPEKFIYARNYSKLLTFTIIIFIIYTAILYLFQKTSSGFKKNLFLVNVIITAVLVLYSWLIYINKLINPSITNRDYLLFLVGLYSLSIVADIFIRTIRDKNVNGNIFIALSWFFSSFIIIWFSNPFFIQITTGRYLITAASALTILIGVIIGSFNTQKFKKYIFLLVSILFLLHLIGSRTYLEHLNIARPRLLTNNLRANFPRLPSFGKTNEPIMVYFQTDNSEFLYHRLVFGFPLIMSYYQNFSYWKNIAYTESWPEVVSAYMDGQSLERFSIPPQKTKIENIYSFLVRGEEIIDTTNITRDNLLKLN